MAFYHHTDAEREMEGECSDRERGRDPDTTTTWSSITPENRERDGAETDRESERAVIVIYMYNVERRVKCFGDAVLKPR